MTGRPPEKWNTKLKRLLADAMLDNAALKGASARRPQASARRSCTNPAADRAKPALVARLCARSDDRWRTLSHPGGGRRLHARMSGAGGGHIDLGHSGGAGA